MPDPSPSLGPPSHLTVTDEQGERRVELHAGQTIDFGRADECDVTLATKRASRQHVRIEWEYSSWLLYHIRDQD